MGLDITAYRKLQPVNGKHTFDHDACYEAGHFHVYEDKDWAERASGLLLGRCYTTTEEDFRFRAGSYSGYNDWRNQLSLMAQDRPAEEVWDDPTGPFAELIHFSDCEGTIGSVVAAKLFLDFQEYHYRAKTWLSGHDGEWFRGQYEKWMKAFEMAADQGAVSFH